MALVATFIGTCVGATAGYFGGKLDNFVMRVTDLFIALPLLVVLILLRNLPERQPWAKQVMGNAGSMRANDRHPVAVLLDADRARIVRGVVLSLKEKEFVEAARALGSSDKRIIFRHLLPNCAGPIIVTVTLNVAAAILTESALSFLGFGVSPPVPTWGNLLADSKGYFGIAPWLVWFPGLTVVLTVLRRELHRRRSARRARSPPTAGGVMSTTAADPVGTPRGAGSTGAVLEIEDLHVTFKTEDGPVYAVRGVDLAVHESEVLGVVGESGSGKSVTMLAAMGLLPKSATITGSVKFRGQELLGLEPGEVRHYRGSKIAMIFQDPLTALNPVLQVGDQIAEAVLAHQDLSQNEAYAKAIKLLDQVGIPQPATRASQYPHEFSGGMRQRAMIAMAISNDPEVLIADEPTTALDVTIQAQILEVIQEVQELTKSAIVFITHDLGVIARLADAGPGDVRRSQRRGRQRRRHLREPRTSLHSGAHELDPEGRRLAPSPDPGLAAEHAGATDGLRVPAAVCLLRRDL